MTLHDPPQTKERLAALDEMRSHLFAVAMDHGLSSEDQVMVAAALLASTLLSSRKHRPTREELDELVRRGEELALDHAEVKPLAPAPEPSGSLEDAFDSPEPASAPAPVPLSIPPEDVAVPPPSSPAGMGAPVPDSSPAVPSAVADSLPGDQLFDEMFDELVTPAPMDEPPATQVLERPDLATDPFGALPSTADVEIAGVLRRFPRFESRDRVVVELAGKEALSEMYTNNISMGGLYIESDDPPDVGTKLTVQLQTPDGNLDLKGEVVHASKDPLGGMPPGIGFQFEKLSASQQQALDSYLLGVASRLEVIEKEADDGVSKRAITLLRKAEEGKLYAAVGIDPRADAAMVGSKLADLEARFKKAAAKAAGSDGLRINNALRVLVRLKEVLGKPTRRLSYDFQHDLERVDERLEEAKKGGATLEQLRGVWAKVFPDRLREANGLVARALNNEKAQDYVAAAELGQRALAFDPFYASLRSRVALWKNMDDIVARMKADNMPSSAWPELCEERGVTMDKLRPIWEQLYPDRVEEAKAFGRKALQAETIKRMDLALVAAHAALDRDPFNERLRAALDEWTRDPTE